MTSYSKDTPPEQYLDEIGMGLQGGVYKIWNGDNDWLEMS